MFNVTYFINLNFNLNFDLDISDVYIFIQLMFLSSIIDNKLFLSSGSILHPRYNSLNPSISNF